MPLDVEDLTGSRWSAASARPAATPSSCASLERIYQAHHRVRPRGRRRPRRVLEPAKFDGLVGMPFPAPANSFPTKDQMADYLEAYAARFALPVRTGARVTRLSRGGAGGYRIEVEGHATIEADQVVVAMASYQRPRTPAFARELRGDIVQLHSKEYRSPAQLRAGGVLIVGAGNSGAEIAVDVAGAHRVWMSGRDVGHIPFRIDGTLSRLLLGRLVLRVAFHRVLTIRTPIGRKVRPKILAQGGTLIRVKPAQLAAIGVERAPRVIGARDGLPLLDDGRTLDVANVIWCTGFHSGFSWIDLPIFNAGADGHGEPAHEGGVVGAAPGSISSACTFCTRSRRR